MPLPPQPLKRKQDVLAPADGRQAAPRVAKQRRRITEKQAPHKIDQEAQDACKAKAPAVRGIPKENAIGDWKGPAAPEVTAKTILDDDDDNEPSVEIVSSKAMGKMVNMLAHWTAKGYANRGGRDHPSGAAHISSTKERHDLAMLIASRITATMELISSSPSLELILSQPVPKDKESILDDLRWHFTVLYPSLRNAEAVVGGPQVPAGHTGDMADRSQMVNLITALHGGFPSSGVWGEDALYLAVHVLDLFISQRRIPKNRQDAIACTALMIGVKFFEYHLPLMQDMVFITSGAFTEEDIQAMEINVLRTIDYKLGRPLVSAHLEPLILMNPHSKRSLIWYIAQLGLLSSSWSNWPPSAHAAAAVLLSNWILGQPLCPPRLASALRLADSSAQRAAIHSIVQELAMFLLDPAVEHAIQLKFKDDRFEGVSADAHAKMAAQVALCFRFTN